MEDFYELLIKIALMSILILGILWLIFISINQIAKYFPLPTRDPIGYYCDKYSNSDGSLGNCIHYTKLK